MATKGISEYLLAAHSDVIQQGGISGEELQALAKRENDGLKLNYLNATCCNMSQLDISAFSDLASKCINLVYLSLSHNALGSLSKIAVFRNLVKLDISHNSLLSLGFRSYWVEMDKLRFLYVNNNHIDNVEDIFLLQSLQNLIVLALHHNPICSDDAYIESVHRALPKLQVLDLWLLTPTFCYYLARYNLTLPVQYQQYDCPTVDVFKENYNTYKVEQMIKRYNSLINDDEMLDNGYKDYYDVFCCRNFNDATCREEARNIIYELSTKCAITVIEKSCRCFLALRRVEIYKEEHTCAATTILQYCTFSRDYRRYYALIKEKAKARKRSAYIIFQALSRRKLLRQAQEQKLQEFMERCAVSKIVVALRRRKQFRYQVDFEQLEIDELNNPEVLHLFVVKTYDIERNTKLFITELFDSLREEIFSSLESNDDSEINNYNKQLLEINLTNYRMITPSNLAIYRYQKVMPIEEHLADELREHYPIEHFVSHRKLERALKMTTCSFKNSQYEQVIRVLKQLCIGEETIEAEHSFVENTGQEFFVLVTFKQKEISAIMKYIIETYESYSYPANEANIKLIKYGAFIFNKLLSAGTRHALIEMIEQYQIPISLSGKSSINSRIVIQPPRNILIASEVVVIQKIARSHLSLKKYILNEFKSVRRVEELILIQRAAEVIEKQIRGVLERFKVLILSKMREVFSSALQYDEFLIDKEVYEELFYNGSDENNTIRPSPFLKNLHVNYSPPVSQQFAKSVFNNCESSDGSEKDEIIGKEEKNGKQLYIEDSNDESGCEQPKLEQLEEAPYWTQFATVCKEQTNIFSAFNGLLYSTLENDANEGYVELHSSFLRASPLSARSLYSWVRFIPNTVEKNFEFFAAQITSKYMQRAGDSGLQAIKTMCGLRKCAGSNAELDRLLDLYELQVEFEAMDYRMTNVNIMKNVNVSDFDSTVLPKELKGFAETVGKQYYVVSLEHNVNTRREDIAFKALLLELLYCNPFSFECNSKSFIARKWVFSMQPGITTSVNDIKARTAILVIEKYSKGLLTFKKYNNMPKPTSFLKKITTLFKNKDKSQTKEFEKAQREKTAIQLIKCLQESNREQAEEVNYENMDFLNIQQVPEYAMTKRQTYKEKIEQISAEARYDSCIDKASKDALGKRNSNYNEIKIFTVKDQLRQNVENEKLEVQTPEKLLIQLEKTCEKGEALVSLNDQIRSEELLNEKVLVPCKCQSPAKRIINFSSSEPGSEEYSRKSEDKNVQKENIEEYVCQADLRYLSAEMSKRKECESVQLAKREYLQDVEQEVELFKSREDEDIITASERREEELHSKESNVKQYKLRVLVSEQRQERKCGVSEKLRVLSSYEK